MTYYAALAAKWATLSPDTTANKLLALNNLTVTGTIPTTFYITGDKILNCINYAEFKALTAAQQSNVLALCRVPGNLLGGSSNTSFIVDGMIIDYFPGAGPTIAALTALAQAATIPWWQSVGSNGPISLTDLIAAGNLT